MTMDNKIISVLHKLVALTGIAFDEMAWEPIQEGGNNRLLKLKIDTAQFILKQYFISREENWDRLKNESLFLGYAQSCGTGVVPKLIWVDALNHFAVHEYIDGKKINPSDLDDDSIEQAISFIEVINQAQFRKTEKAKALSQASDAC
ncbi:MAG: hypothetical protein KJ668_09900, partial [Proteobacteria bacterium]|nr:hypothetical protein [Pseudomonadota bacterium]